LTNEAVVFPLLSLSLLLSIYTPTTRLKYEKKEKVVQKREQKIDNHSRLVSSKRHGTGKPFFLYPLYPFYVKNVSS
jgi:hypothetical protein